MVLGPGSRGLPFCSLTEMVGFRGPRFRLGQYNEGPHPVDILCVMPIAAHLPCLRRPTAGQSHSSPQAQTGVRPAAGNGTQPNVTAIRGSSWSSHGHLEVGVWAPSGSS